MKILIINSRYFLSAGPEKYMFGLKKILESNGHKVIPFSTKNSKNLKTKYEKYFVAPIGGEDKIYYEEYKKDFKTILQMIGRQFYSFDVKRKLDALIKETKPDIAYILHHYNKLSPSIIDICKNNKIPVVMRLSDFFLLCPMGLLTRDSKICEECINKSLFCGIKHKCVKNSIIASFIKVGAMKFHRLINIYNKVDFIVSPSLFTLKKVKPFLNKNKFIYLPTFIINQKNYNYSSGNYALIVGRVEEEKGILFAIKAFEKTNCKLKIVGKSHSGYDKILKRYVKEHKLSNIEFLGAKYDKELDELYAKSRFLIIPTVCYENMPNVALEAMLYSKPILTMDLGSMKEIVEDDYNGYLIEPNNIAILRQKVVILFKNNKLCERLGKNSYNDTIIKYNPEIHYQNLINVFNQAIKEEKAKWKH